MEPKDSGTLNGGTVPYEVVLKIHVCRIHTAYLDVRPF